MDAILKVCALINEIPPYCLLVVIPFLIYGVFKKEFFHVGINALVIVLSYGAYWLAEYQHNLWSYSKPNFSEVIYHISLVSYAILSIAVCVYAFKILIIAMNKVDKQKKRQKNSQSLSSTRLEAVG